MKRIHLILIICLALCLLLPAAGAEERAKPEQDILVLFTSDVHCGVDQNFGYAGLQAVRDAAAASGQQVLLVDNGDAIQGESIGILSQGQISLELMNAMGYDVAIPGNHEFDYGVKRFLELAEMADFPYICCNFRKDGELYFPPYLVVERGGVRIGFVGATTPSTLTSSNPTYFQDENGNYLYDFCQSGDGERFYAAVQQAVDGARAEGADYVILLAHLGDEASYYPYSYADVLAHTTGIDALLDGHSHDTNKAVMKNRDGQDVVRQACGTKMACIGWLRISAADGAVDTGLYTWNNSVSVPDLLGLDNEMAREVRARTEAVNRDLAEVIGVTHAPLMVDDPVAREESGRPIRIIRRAESNLGDLCTDALRAATGADIGLMGGGNIRVGLPAGELTVHDILNVTPFGNRVAVLEVTGRQLLDALEWGAHSVPLESGGFLQVSGVTYEIHTYLESSCARDEYGMFTGVAGEYRVRNVTVGGEPLDLDKTYTLCGQDYTLLQHGDGLTAFDGARLIELTQELDYELIIRYIRENLGGVVGEAYAAPYGQERIVAVPEPPAPQP